MPISARELIANIKELPPLPQVAAQVLHLASDPDSTTDDLRRVVETDSALAAQVLKIANSPMFGMVREVKTLNQAVMTLGFSAIRSVAIAASAKGLYHRGSTGLQERLLWEHALISALAGRAYAKIFRSLRADEAFLGGLLHDIGRSVMGINAPELYGHLIRAIYNGEVEGEAIDHEVEIFGFDHAMVGEALLFSWNLAPSLVAAVRWHHSPVDAPSDYQDLAAMVALGNQLALERAPGIGGPESLLTPTRQALEILGIKPEQFEGHKMRVIEALESDKGLVKGL